MYYPEILRGACDIHVHTAPSIIARELDAFEMARRAEKAGYAAVVLKDHHYCTAPIAYEVRNNLLQDSKLRFFGSVVLNNSAGGMSPHAAEVAIAYGAKTVWLPTTSSENHIEHATPNNFHRLPLNIPDTPIRMTDADGHVLPQVCGVLSVIAEHPGVVLGTGHISAAEVDAVLEKAFSLGIKNIFVDHPTLFIGATKEQLVRWANMGAYIEHTATGSLPGSTSFHTHHLDIVEMICDVGPEHTIISSDAGQKGNGDPVEDLDRFLKLLEDNGISKDDLSMMVRENPIKILGL